MHYIRTNNLASAYATHILNNRHEYSIATYLLTYSMERVPLNKPTANFAASQEIPVQYGKRHVKLLQICNKSTIMNSLESLIYKCTANAID
jgi:hypothetical protein